MSFQKDAILLRNPFYSSDSSPDTCIAQAIITCQRYSIAKQLHIPELQRTTLTRQGEIEGSKTVTRATAEPGVLFRRRPDYSSNDSNPCPPKAGRRGFLADIFFEPCLGSLQCPKTPEESLIYVTAAQHINSGEEFVYQYQVTRTFCMGKNHRY